MDARALRHLDAYWPLPKGVRKKCACRRQAKYIYNRTLYLCESCADAHYAMVCVFWSANKGAKR